MKKILILLFIFFQVSYSQSTINLKFHDPCTDNIIQLDYSMQSEEGEPMYSKKGDSILNLKKGKYKVYAFIGDIDNKFLMKRFEFTKEIYDNEIYTDTIEMPKVFFKYRNLVKFGIRFVGFYSCDKKCNGYIKEYYKNGKIRIEGDFKEGIPINEVKKYNSKGKLIETYLFNGEVLEIYDINRNLIHSISKDS